RRDRRPDREGRSRRPSGPRGRAVDGRLRRRAAAHGAGRRGRSGEGRRGARPHRRHRTRAPREGMSVDERTLEWLERRRPAPPAALFERMAEAVRAAGAAVEGVPPIPAALGTAALDRLRAALQAPEGRAAALDLLAADALL